MYPKIIELDVPIWVIAPREGQGMDADRKYSQSLPKARTHL